MTVKDSQNCVLDTGKPQICRDCRIPFGKRGRNRKDWAPERGQILNYKKILAYLPEASQILSPPFCPLPAGLLPRPDRPMPRIRAPIIIINVMYSIIYKHSSGLPPAGGEGSHPVTSNRQSAHRRAPGRAFRPQAPRFSAVKGRETLVIRLISLQLCPTMKTSSPHTENRARTRNR